MILRSRTSPTAVYIRVLIAWLLTMQPMLGGYYAAQAANAPLVLELCSGAGAPSDRHPAGKSRDHSTCCLACTPTSAPPPTEGSALAAPASGISSSFVPRPQPLAVAQAGLGPQSARAPPGNSPPEA